MTVYLIILGDIMVGSAPLYGGLLASWFGLDAGSTWYLSRPFVVSTAYVLPCKGAARAAKRLQHLSCMHSFPFSNHHGVLPLQLGRLHANYGC